MIRVAPRSTSEVVARALLVVLLALPLVLVAVVAAWLLLRFPEATPWILVVAIPAAVAVDYSRRTAVQHLQKTANSLGRVLGRDKKP
jgi:hypothetical protein